MGERGNMKESVGGKTQETLTSRGRKDTWTQTRTKEKCCFGAARFILGLPLPYFSDRGIKLISPETLRLFQDLLLVLLQLGSEDFLLGFSPANEEVALLKEVFV